MARPSKKVKCPICGKEVHARGLYGHMKLKDHVILSNPTRVADKNLNDSSGDSGKIEKKVNDSSRKSLIKKINSEKLAPAESQYFGLKGLEADRRQFKPTFSDYLNHYSKHPELAVKAWELIIRHEEKFTSVELLNPESYRALRQIFG
ncbi:MAG: hypothetical protein IPI88_18840 [Chitinophagaceae bacterium]|nr:hypothetical protein [Chitinophagaceae bacterium]